MNNRSINLRKTVLSTPIKDKPDLDNTPTSSKYNSPKLIQLIDQKFARQTEILTAKIDQAVSKAMSAMETKIIEMTKDINDLKKRIIEIENQHESISVLKNEIHELKFKLHRQDNLNVACNLRLNGIPSYKNENLYEIFKTMCESLEIVTPNINSIHRINTRSKTNDGTILIKLCSPMHKNFILKTIAQFKRVKKTQLSLTISKDGLFNMVRVLTKQKPGLTIVHINAQSLQNKLDEFRQIFISSNIDIICVSETWFQPEIVDGIYNLQGYRLFRSDRDSHAGGVCMYVRNELNSCMKLKSDSGSQIEFIFLEVCTADNTKLLVGTVYRPHRTIPFNNLIDTLENLTLLYNDVIIAGDFNSNILVEKRLNESMNTLDLYSVNTIIPTHFSNSGNTLLDLIFVNNCEKVLLYDQLSASSFSKRDLLFLTYDVTVFKESKVFEFRDFRRINYNLLNDIANNINWNEVYYYEAVEDQINFMQGKITILFDACVPKKVLRTKPTQQPWFNHEIKKLIRDRDNKYKRWKRYKTTQLYDHFKLARREVTKAINIAKSSYYQRKFNDAVDSGAKWMTIRNIGIGRKSTTPINIDINDLNEIFANQTALGNQNNNSACECLPSCGDLSFEEFTFKCVDQYDVRKSFLSIKSNAVGMDELNPKFLKLLLPICLPYFTHIFNTVLTKSIFPNTWKYTKIIPLPKPNKEFRPIAILPYLSKVLERLMYEQINTYIISKKLLTERQSGFRPMRSCATVLTDVVEYLRSKMDQNLVSILVLLDHSKAFDTVNHSILVQKLQRRFNFSQSACRLVSSYLSGRTQSVCHNSENSNILSIYKGVPQGSILGPLLFCIYVNDLPLVLHHCNIHLYADDVQVYTSANLDDLPCCISKLNDDLDRINSWAYNNDLKLNPKKSKCLLISKNKFINHSQYQITINNTNIDIVQTATNLGVIFNNSLTWTNHLQQNIAKTYGMLRSLWAVQLSTPIQIRMLLAKTYLVPTLLYGIEIFANCSCDDKQKLLVVYNNIARYVFNKKRYEHISSFSYQLFNMSFENLIKFRFDFTFRIKAATTNQIISLMLKWEIRWKMVVNMIRK
ncbi:uncharacterized protein LOC142231083 [Haematobia irritans]|uniref:uncharacterized protein LOC142231083 n=1 Tax=Haematobia irritans TaxID=7368 RepID=UPI003F4FC08F